MPKDPAVNWYWDNFDGGTKLMTMAQVGCYVRLLSAQFHCGDLTLENVKTILGSHFAEWDKCLKAKFDQNQDGAFFNNRLKHEIEKRLNEKSAKSKGGQEAMKKRWGDKTVNKILTNSLNKTVNKILTNSLNKTDNKTLELELKLNTETKNENGVGQKIPDPPPEIIEDKTSIVGNCHRLWKTVKGTGVFDEKSDYPQILQILAKIAKAYRIPGEVTDPANFDTLSTKFNDLAAYMHAGPEWMAGLDLPRWNKFFESVLNSYESSKNKTNGKNGNESYKEGADKLSTNPFF